MADHPYAPFIALMDRAAAEPDVDLRDDERCGCRFCEEARQNWDEFLAGRLW